MPYRTKSKRSGASLGALKVSDDLLATMNQLRVGVMRSLATF